MATRSHLAGWVCLLLGAVCLATLAEGLAPETNVRRIVSADCKREPLLEISSRNETRTVFKPEVKLWQGIVLLICFGAFALFVVLIHRLIRVYIFYDAHLLDTYFDGGGDMNFGLIAASVVAKWTWSSTFSWSSNLVSEYGLVGHFWFAAGAVIQLFLFAIVACEIRIKAPGAKTYLQVVNARFGPMAHITLMVFALLANLLIAGMVMTEGTRMLTKLTEDLDHEVACILLAVVIVFYTVVGGVGGGVYVAYFACVLITAITMYFLTDVYWDPFDRHDYDINDTSLTDKHIGIGSRDKVYREVYCGKAELTDNEDESWLTFISEDALVQGVLVILSGFSAVFVDQSFWQTAVAGKPAHTVWGFIFGGLVWFGIPLAAAFTFGMSYLSQTVVMGKHLVSEADTRDGLLPVYMSQRIHTEMGDFLFFVMLMAAVVTTASAEVLASSSIIIYDIYQTYIGPFRPTPIPDNKQMTVRMQRAIRNEEYLEYDRRCVVLKHVVVVSISVVLVPLTLVMHAIDVDLPWLFLFTAILVGSCVIPIALAITWHRVTGVGVTVGALGGLVCGFIAWLVYAGVTKDDVLELRDGLEQFREKTGQPYAMLTGLAVSLGMGGLLCVLTSLTCGGCDPGLMEEEEWEKTRQIDNPILPWSIKYAPNVGAVHMAKGRPHFYTIRRTFKVPEIIAYIVGVVLAVGAILVWPASMLTADVFSSSMFNGWAYMVLIWLIFSLAFIVLVPIIYEIAQVCQQAYYNRMWARSPSAGKPAGRYDEMESEPTPSPAPVTTIMTGPPAQRQDDMHSLRTDSEFNANYMPGENSMLDAKGKERWKTYIQL